MMPRTRTIPRASRPGVRAMVTAVLLLMFPGRAGRAGADCSEEEREFLAEATRAGSVTDGMVKSVAHASGSCACNLARFGPCRARRRKLVAQRLVGKLAIVAKWASWAVRLLLPAHLL